MKVWVKCYTALYHTYSFATVLIQYWLVNELISTSIVLQSFSGVNETDELSPGLVWMEIPTPVCFFTLKCVYILAIFTDIFPGNQHQHQCFRSRVSFSSAATFIS